MAEHPPNSAAEQGAAQERPDAAEPSADLLAVASHEIRTPLGAILTTSEALLETALDDRQHRYAIILRDAAAALIALTDGLLQATAGGPLPAPVAFRPLDLVRSVVGLFALQAAHKGLTLETTAGPGARRLLDGHPQAVRQVLTNLVDNAVKYTAAGAIRVAVSVDGDSLALRVSDSGGGIAPADRDRIFNAYERLDANATGLPGSGLGLWTARRVAARLGGRLAVVESSPAGTTFALTVPVAPARRGAGAEHASGEEAAPLVGPFSVLVVDDSQTARTLAEAILTAFGWPVTTAASAAEALDLIGAGAPGFDCVLTDLTMPGMDGGAFAARVAEFALARPLPVIAVSAAATGRLPVPAEAGRFAGVIAKPYTPEQLYRRIAAAVAGERA